MPRTNFIALSLVMFFYLTTTGQDVTDPSVQLEPLTLEADSEPGKQLNFFCSVKKEKRKP